MPDFCEGCLVVLLKHHLKGHLRTPHNIIHSGEKPFACGQCEYRGAWEGGLASHMRTHTNEHCKKPRRDLNSAPRKSRRAADVASVTRHSNPVSIPRNIWKEFILRWMIMLISSRMMTIPTGEEPYRCIVCDKWFGSSFEAHLNYFIAINYFINYNKLCMVI